MRIIPKTAKVKIEFFKNISLADTFIALAALALEVLVFTTNIPPIPKYAIMIMILAISSFDKVRSVPLGKITNPRELATVIYPWGSPPF